MTWIVVVLVIVGIGIVAAAVTGVVKRHQHPEAPPTPEALEEQQGHEGDYKITPGVDPTGGNWH
jgi:hypothetical protein